MKDIAFVTGSTGFIGSHLVDALVARGDNVRCLVRKTSDVGHLKKLRVDIVYGDLLNKQSLKKAVRGIKTVYHLAAKVRPSRTIENFSNIYQRVNVIGTMNLAEVCFINGIQKFIYFSSIAATGPGEVLNEDSLPKPITEYGKSKFETEKFLLHHFSYRKFPVLIIRPGQIYGPRNLSMLILFRLIKKGILPIFGRGDNLIPLCYIDNLIKGTLLAEKNGRIGEIYFIIDGHYSIKEFTQLIAETMGVHLAHLFIPKNIAYAIVNLKEKLENIFRFRIYPFHMDLGINNVITASTNWVCCNNKIKEELLYEPAVDLKEGITGTVKWYTTEGLI